MGAFGVSLVSLGGGPSIVRPSDHVAVAGPSEATAPSPCSGVAQAPRLLILPSYESRLRTASPARKRTRSDAPASGTSGSPPVAGSAVVVVVV